MAQIGSDSETRISWNKFRNDLETPGVKKEKIVIEKCDTPLQRQGQEMRLQPISAAVNINYRASPKL